MNKEIIIKLQASGESIQLIKLQFQRLSAYHDLYQCTMSSDEMDTIQEHLNKEPGYQKEVK